VGYCIDLEESTIVIKKENADTIVELLRNFAKQKFIKNESLMWIDLDELINANSINELFDEMRYQLKVNDNGDYEIDYFSGEKLGDDYEIFQIIAPCIENGYIELNGEDGFSWRWVFKNGECRKIYPTVIW